MPKSRARKTSTLPTRIYSYGCLPAIVGGDLLEEQLRLAHRYRNKLVEIERERRRQVDEVLCFWPEIARASEAAHLAETAVDESYRALRAAKAGAGREADIGAERDAVELAKSQQKEAWASLKAAKAGAKGDERRAVLLKWCDELAASAKRNARAACGVYWGTYLQIEAAVEQAIKEAAPGLPRFTRYEGEGKIAVQIQKSKPLDERTVFGEDTRLRLAPIPVDTYERSRHARRRASRTTVSIRAGSYCPDCDGKGRVADVECTRCGGSGDGRGIRWVTLPVILHRPLPDGSQIKWAWILRKKKGKFFDYRLQLAVESAEFLAYARSSDDRDNQHHSIAIDIGWRRRGGDRVRVGYWMDTAGLHGEIEVPEKFIRGLAKCDDLRSIRDKNFDDVKVALGSARWDDRRSDRTYKTWPEWFVERTRNLANWRAQDGLHRLWDDWRERRFSGDEALAEIVKAWAKQDRHLLAWEACQRSRRLGHRRKQYRIFAARVAREYGTIVVEDFDMPDLPDWEVRDATEGVPSDGRPQRRTSRRAASGELRECVRRAAAKYGARLVDENPQWTTRRCCLCGCQDEWDAAPKIEHTCATCGTTWDQDWNACVNLLRASGSVPPDWLPPLAGENPKANTGLRAESATA